MIKVLFFGMLAEKVNNKETLLQHKDTLEEIIQHLYKQFPQLEKSKFKISVNRNLTNDMKSLVQDGSEIALLPPYSGG